jgi:hypothetical protein
VAGTTFEIRLSKRLRWPAPDAPNVSEILEIAFIDQLQTFAGKKIQIRVTDNCQPFSARHLSLGFGRSLTRLGPGL